MKKIVILGNSPASARIIEEIRSFDQESQIMLIGYDGYYPYDREKFPDYLAGRIGLDALNVRGKEFYKTHRVDVILDQTISRVNLKRKKIYTEQKIVHDYDVLLMGEVPVQKFSDIKGGNKDRIYSLSQLKSVKQIFAELPLVGEIVIESDTVSGFEAAVVLAQAKKDVVLLTSENGFLSYLLKNEKLAPVLERIELEGVKIYIGNNIVEILGEGEVRAVRLNNGKVLAADMVIFSSLSNDLRFISDSVNVVGNFISVDENFQCNEESFFAFDKTVYWDAGVSAEEFTPLDILNAQGAFVGKLFSPQKEDLEYPKFHKTINFNLLKIDILGEFQEKIGLINQCSYSQESFHVESLMLKGDKLVSAFLINAKDKVELYYGLLGDRLVLEENTAVQPQIADNLNFSSEENYSGYDPNDGQINNQASGNKDVRQNIEDNSGDFEENALK